MATSDGAEPAPPAPPGSTAPLAATTTLDNLMRMVENQQRQIGMLMTALQNHAQSTPVRRPDIHKLPLVQLRGLDRIGKFAGGDDFEIWREKLMSHLISVPGVTDFLAWGERQKWEDLTEEVVHAYEDPNIEDFNPAEISAQLYAVLIELLSGDPWSMTQNAGRNQGLRAWENWCHIIHS